MYGASRPVDPASTTRWFDSFDSFECCGQTSKHRSSEFGPAREPCGSAKTAMNPRDGGKPSNVKLAPARAVVCNWRYRNYAAVQRSSLEQSSLSAPWLSVVAALIDHLFASCAVLCCAALSQLHSTPFARHISAFPPVHLSRLFPVPRLAEPQDLIRPFSFAPCLLAVLS